MVCALALAGAFLLAAGARAQNTTITASNIADIAGAPVTGNFCLRPAQQFVRGGGGNVMPIWHCWLIAGGVLQSGVVVADTSLTNPANVCYQVVIQNSVPVQLASYACMQPSGTTYSFDNFVQASPPYINTSFTVPSFLTNGVPNAGQTSLNIAATSPLTATNSTNTVTIACPTCSSGGMVWPSLPGIMVYGGSSAYGASLTAPTSTIVGITDTQTLTNKTVDGVTPTIFGYVDPTSSIQTQLNAKAAAGSNSDITSLSGVTTINNTSQSYNASNQTVFFGAEIPGATVGARDVAYGYNVLGSGVTGYYNVAIGVDVLNGVTSGYQNTGVGSDVMNAGTVTGVDNNAFGFEVLQQLTSGDANNAFGSNALNSITAGGYNAAFGDSALQYITGGSDNTAFGYHAGTFVSGGADNLTPNNSLFLGAQTEAATNNDTNEIVIGYGAIGNGTNTATYGGSAITDSYIPGKLHASASYLTGTLPHAQLPALVSGDIPNNAANTTGTAANVTGTVAIANGGTGQTGASAALAALGGQAALGYTPVANTTTVNAHALSANVVISASDLTTGTLPHAQLPSLVSGDIPNNAANTTGTAAGLSGSQTAHYVYAAPSGSTGTPSFRALVSGDVPNLNQNTTGTAANVTGTVAVGNGGTGDTTGTLPNHPEVYKTGVLTQNYKVYLGGATLSGGSVSVTLSNSFSFTASIICFGNDASSTTPEPVNIIPSSYSAITIYGNGNDQIGFMCFGY